jgi:hypothetical protein
MLQYAMDSQPTIKYSMLAVAALALLAMIAAVVSILFGVDISRLLF